VISTYTEADLERIQRHIKPEDVEAYKGHLPPRELCPESPTIKQYAFLMAPHREVFFGGAAGPGKSSGLLMGALRFCHVPGFRALLLRRTFRQLDESLIARAKTWMGPAMAKGLVEWNSTSKRFTFPSGAQIGFGYLDHDDDAYQYDSAEFQYVGFDELTSFTEWRYNYLFLRLRTVVCPACQAIRDAEYSATLTKLASSKKYNLDYVTRAILKDGNLPRYIEDKERAGELDPEVKRLSRDALSQITPKAKRMVTPAPRGTEHKQLGHVPLQMRSASNPGNQGHDWVKARFIDDGTIDYETERGRMGHGGDPCKNGPKDCPECGTYYDRKDYEKFDDPGRCPNDNAQLVQGRFFIPALIHENPHLRRAEYEANIKRGDAVRGAQMLTGNWDIRPHGDLFDSDNFDIIDALPAGIHFARGWDTAGTKVADDATEAERKKADWTVGVLLGEDKNGIVYIGDVVRKQTDALGVDELVKQTAENDVTTFGRGHVTHIIQQEPGDAGKAYAEHFARGPLRGMLYEIEHLSGAKYVRALPMSSHSKARNIKVLRGKWNKEFFDELNVAGPNDKLYDHDDQWDAASSAFNWLMGNRREYSYQAAPKEGAPSQGPVDPRFAEDMPMKGSRRFGPGAW
jgi:predicted phage terminase large subunit-like protein